MSAVRLRAAVLVLGVAAAAVTLTPIASYADSWAATDPGRDMVQYTFTDTDEDPVAMAAPDATNADVTGIHANYGSSWLTLRMSFTDLRVGDADYVGGMFRLNTKSGKQLMFQGIRQAGASYADWADYRVRSGKPFACQGVSHSMSLRTNSVEVHVPVRCLGKGWVRVGGAGVTVRFEDDGADGIQAVEQIDDALLAGSIDRIDVAVGSRVYRG